MKTRELTQERLKQKIIYDPENGLFSRTPPENKRSPGRLDKDGYLTISVDGVKHQAHRLAFLYMVGRHPIGIDHINRVRNDNRWENLREATHLENMQNTQTASRDGIGRGASGVVGVYWDGRKNKWHVHLRRRGKSYYGGYYPTISEAAADANALRKCLQLIESPETRSVGAST